MAFEPNYRYIVEAATNQRPERLPLYEHAISDKIMERIMGKKFAHLLGQSEQANIEYFQNYCEFCRQMGYDAVMFEGCVTTVLPGGGALGGHKEGVIQTREDFEKYPWDSIEKLYFDHATPLFTALREAMPEGMRAIGGVGNGVFECVQDLVGYTQLCYMSVDDPELYREMFQKIGDMLCGIWKRFLDEFGDIYCVCRFGDDLGFKSTTLLPTNDVLELIVPQYKRIVDIVHGAGKPFLLHSCGCIFDVMDDIISKAGIDAKHSNEDQIAPFSEWIDRYGDRIGNFGGIDTDVLCDISEVDVADYVTELYHTMRAKNGGVALGSGNSIPDYVSPERYVLAVETVRKLRGE